MISLSAIAKEEKNKLSTGSSFVILLDIKLGEETIHICYNTESIMWNNAEHNDACQSHTLRVQC